MCWTNYMAIPIVLKKPLRVYKSRYSIDFWWLYKFIPRF